MLDVDRGNYAEWTQARGKVSVNGLGKTIGTHPKVLVDSDLAAVLAV